jgi:hypothetical protein
LALSLEREKPKSKKMRNTLFIALFAWLLLPSCSSGQFDIKKLGKEIDKQVNGGTLTNKEIIDGLKQALTIGSNNASGTAAQFNGFYGNGLIKIPFPPEAAKMETRLRSMGMNKQVDDFILTINRAAEEAAKDAAPIFVNAITSMTINDGVGILRGNDTAATHYLRDKTNAQLYAKFLPVIQSAIRKVDVTKYWNPLATTYNRIPMVDPVNPNLEDYITNRALQGLFLLVSQEETKIRRDPAARVTDLLKKVFGSK